MGTAAICRRQNTQVSNCFTKPSKILRNSFKGQYTIEVIDLLVHPQLAEGDQIFAIPTLVRKVPEPIRKIIGDLSNEEKVLVGLNIRPVKQLI
jgi:circadian clock protein KaiB